MNKILCEKNKVSGKLYIKSCSSNACKIMGLSKASKFKRKGGSAVSKCIVFLQRLCTQTMQPTSSTCYLRLHLLTYFFVWKTEPVIANCRETSRLRKSWSVTPNLLSNR